MIQFLSQSGLIKITSLLCVNHANILHTSIPNYITVTINKPNVLYKLDCVT